MVKEVIRLRLRLLGLTKGIDDASSKTFLMAILTVLIFIAGPLLNKEFQFKKIVIFVISIFFLWILFLT